MCTGQIPALLLSLLHRAPCASPHTAVLDRSQKRRGKGLIKKDNEEVERIMKMKDIDFYEGPWQRLRGQRMIWHCMRAGQERRKVPGARHAACTVEMASVTRTVEVSLANI
jgi:hypothetical protein